MGSGSSSNVAKFVLGNANGALPMALHALSGSEALTILRSVDENDITALATQSGNKNMTFFHNDFSYEYNGSTSNPPNIADGAPCYGGQDFSFYGPKIPYIGDIRAYVMGQLTPDTADGYNVDVIVADITQAVNGICNGPAHVWLRTSKTYEAPKVRGIFYMDLALYTYACETDEGDTMVMFSFLFTFYGGTI
eukprot:gene9499-11175_t